MKRHLQYLRNEAIDAVTAQRIREYESKTGGTVTLPVPVDRYQSSLLMTSAQIVLLVGLAKL